MIDLIIRLINTIFSKNASGDINILILNRLNIFITTDSPYHIGPMASLLKRMRGQSGRRDNGSKTFSSCLIGKEFN